MDKKTLIRIIEALVFASNSPINVKQLQSILEDVDKNQIEETLQDLETELKAHAFSLKKVSGGYEFATRPEYSPWIKKMLVGKEKSRLTRAALETLAIIAFKQPISRVEVSAIRGVNSDGVIKGLLERKLIDIAGRDEGVGRALLFHTTNEFLQYFGINQISDLPRPREIEELLATGEGGKLLQDLPEEVLLKVTEDEDKEERDEETKNQSSSEKEEPKGKHE